MVGVLARLEQAVAHGQSGRHCAHVAVPGPGGIRGFHADSRREVGFLPFQAEESLLAQSHHDVTDSVGFAQLPGAVLPVSFLELHARQLQHAGDLHLVEDQEADVPPVIRHKIRDGRGIHHGLDPQLPGFSQNVPHALLVDLISGHAILSVLHGGQRLVDLLVRDSLLVVGSQHDHIVALVVDEHHAAGIFNTFPQNHICIVNLRIF